MQIIKVGDVIATKDGDVEVLGLSINLNGDGYITYQLGENKVFESVFKFKGKIFEPIDKIDLDQVSN